MKKLIKKSILNKFLHTFALFFNLLSKFKRVRSKQKPLVKYKTSRVSKRHRVINSTDNQVKYQRRDEFGELFEQETSSVYYQYICQDGKIYALAPHRTKAYDTEKNSSLLGAVQFKAILVFFVFILVYVGLNNLLIMFVYYDTQHQSTVSREKKDYFLPLVSILKSGNKIDKISAKETDLDKVLLDNFTILIDPLDVQFKGFEKHFSSKRYVFLSESYFDKIDNETLETTNVPCVLPKLDPYEKELMQFVKKEPPIVCNPKQNWIYVQNGTIRVSKSAVQNHGVVVCAYIPLYRGNNDFTVYEGSRIFPVMDKMPLISDFFKIDCRSKDGAIYSNIHSGIAYDSSLHIRHMWNPLPKQALGYNVLMFGFDSVSRMSWIRMLPKSYAYMVQQGFVILKGYNIVGDGTPQALLPILTGKRETELHEARRGFANASNVDDFPWIWKDFKNAGYVTQWAEDMQSIGTFQLRMLGFKQQPVDHYMRLFYLEAEKYYGRFRKLCLGSLSRHENMINWVKEFFSVYDSKPKFSFIFHSEASHNHNNPLSLLDEDLKKFLQYLKLTGIMENTILMFMSDHGVRVSDIRKYSQGKLEERLPFFSVSMPRSFQEQYPEQMKNLRQNSRKLTTPFDIHETFKHLLNFDGYKRRPKKLPRGISLFRNIPVNRSCEDAQIEAHWCSCLNWKNVDIYPKNSSINKSSELMAKKYSPSEPNLGQYSPLALFVAHESVKFINSLIDKELKLYCEKLGLYSIHKLSRLIINRQVLAFKQSKDIHGREAMFEEDSIIDKYFNQDFLKPLESNGTDNSSMASDHLNFEYAFQIVLTTWPGNGTFELSCWYNRYTGRIRFNKNEISRINSYKSSANCVLKKRPDLRPYCFCKYL